MRQKRCSFLQSHRTIIVCLHTTCQDLDRFLRILLALLCLYPELQPVSDERMQGKLCSLLICPWGDALQQRQFVRLGDEIPKSISIPSAMESMARRLLARVNTFHVFILVILVLLVLILVVLVCVVLVVPVIPIVLNPVSNAEYLYPFCFTVLPFLIFSEQRLCN